MNASRDFLGTVIASGLELEMLKPEDVIALVSMEVLAHHLPVELKARLLSAALKSSSMTATLVLDTLGVEGIVEHAPAPLLYQVLANGANRALGKQEANVTTSAAKQSNGVAGRITSGAAAAAGVGARKPNISARVRAGATSRPVAVAPDPEADDSAFDVDTRVGAEQPGDFDVLDDNAYVGDDITAHGKD